MNSAANNVILVSRRWSHHAAHSGYDLLDRYVGTPLTAPAALPALLPERLLWLLNHDMAGYDRVAAALELMAARHMARHRKNLYHIIYADNSYKYLGLLNGWRGHKVVATYHHPPSKLAAWVQSTDALARLSAVITVASNQHCFFGRVLPPERIACIPVPVDTGFFVPPADFSQREAALCLFVGAHLRDLKTLAALMEDARLVAPELRFALVLQPDNSSAFDHVVANFTMHIGLTETELLRLYQRATVLVQPLLDGTANIAVLEAMSCGLPIVVTDIGGIRDYVDQSCARFVPPFRADTMLEAVVDLVRNRAVRMRMSVAARRRALAFDWKLVTERIRELYARVSEAT